MKLAGTMWVIVTRWASIRWRHSSVSHLRITTTRPPTARCTWAQMAGPAW